MNSLKMKLSVTLGVAHMVFGLLLGMTNYIFYGDRAGLYFEFIPQVVFLMCTFGYMIVIIIYKWCVDWTVSSVGAPNLIQTMIKMFLNPGSVEPSKQLYPGQAGIQVILLLCAVCAVPVMLLGKPLANKKKREAEHRARHGGASDYDILVMQNEEKEGDVSESHGDHEEEHSFGDDMIHQSIHTIEFVLGAVSNTASYLRLWALSLAHAQLAQVFWDRMMMQYGIDTGSPIMTMVGFAAWCFATFGVLLCMDVLECFLHALRLHWVRFTQFPYAAQRPADASKRVR